MDERRLANNYSEKLSLFVDVKRSAERILSYPSPSLCSIYGGINVFVKYLENIFQHRLLESDKDYVPFLACLSWLKPVLASDIKALLKVYQASISKKVKPNNYTNLGLKILTRCLLTGVLNECTLVLLRDVNIVNQYYDSGAFLNDYLCQNGLLSCIKAVEDRSSKILANISLDLIDSGVMQYCIAKFDRIHKLDPAEVLQSNKDNNSTTVKEENFLHPLHHDIDVPHSSNSVVSSRNRPYKFSEKSTVESNRLVLRKTDLPDVVACAEMSENVKMNASLQKSACSSTNVVQSEESNILKSKSALKISSTKWKTTSDPQELSPTSSEVKKSQHKRSASDMTLTEAKKINQPIDADIWSAPSDASSLIEYLHNEDLSTCEDLKKENAHFHLSEMLMTVMEEQKCGSGTDFRSLKKGSSIQIPKNRHEDFYDDISPISSEFTTSIEHSSPIVGFSGSFDVDLNEGDASSSVTMIDNLGKSDSRDGIPAPNQQSNFESQIFSPVENSSAESIAINLLRAFTADSNNSDDIEWLVSENDVPQKLLPLPDSTMIDPEPEQTPARPREVSITTKNRIRGSENWAPPRFQLIFNVHKNRDRSQSIANQKYMCAGCGTNVEKAFIKRFRYCEYTGKYFCSCCHNNTLHVIPAHIFNNFNFKKYKVSNFSDDLLRKIHSEPLFNINDINQALYSKSKSLSHCLDLRNQIGHLVKYLDTCRYFYGCAARYGQASLEEHHSSELEASICRMMKEMPSHILKDEPHIYSIEDLMAVKSGELEKTLKAFTKACSSHVTSCDCCSAKGFVCEICGNAGSILFPHQTKNIVKCDTCMSCFHKKCFANANGCPKCLRKEKWKKMQDAESPPNSSVSE